MKFNSWEHQIWATISGSSIDQLQARVDAAISAGVKAIEYRTDLIPSDIWPDLVNLKCQKPALVAHFGEGLGEMQARESLELALSQGFDGIICHSRASIANEMSNAASSKGKAFCAAFHSQFPISFEEAVAEFNHQSQFNPLFRKIACRAEKPFDAVELLRAVSHVSNDGGAPVVGAVFGKHRWARIAMPHVGSCITFIVPEPVPNEVGGDDAQIQSSELAIMGQVRGILPPMDN